MLATWVIPPDGRPDLPQPGLALGVPVTTEPPVPAPEPPTPPVPVAPPLPPFPPAVPPVPVDPPVLGVPQVPVPPVPVTPPVLGVPPVPVPPVPVVPPVLVEPPVPGVPPVLGDPPVPELPPGPLDAQPTMNPNDRTRNAVRFVDIVLISGLDRRELGGRTGPEVHGRGALVSD